MELYVTNGSAKLRRHQHRFSQNVIHVWHQKYVFQILSQKTAQIAKLKNPDLDLIRRIHPECGFYRFMIRFWICPKKANSVFGFGNSDLDFPKKTHPSFQPMRPTVGLRVPQAHRDTQGWRLSLPNDRPVTCRFSYPA